MRDGLVVVDKPAGCTSHDVVAKLRKAYGQRRVARRHPRPRRNGCAPRGSRPRTRLLRFLQEAGKSYRGRVVFGIATSTLDASGEVIEQEPMPLQRADVERTATRFVGEIEQLPPMVSAVKVGGRRLHQLAREGVDVERAPWRVRVDRFVVEDFEPGPYPEATVLVECGSGTYVRSLAADLGVALGGCADLATLRRLSIGSFTLAEAHPLDAIARIPTTRCSPSRPDARPRACRPRRRAGSCGAPRHRLSGRLPRRARRRPFALVAPGDDLVAVYERRGAACKPAVVIATENTPG